METTITLYEETMFGERTNALSLTFLTARITARELIRSRVHHEVGEYNRKQGESPYLHIQPTETEKRLNDRTKRSDALLNEETQFARALEAFERNQFFLLVENRQIEHLDESFEIGSTTAISFIRLVPLVGG